MPFMALMRVSLAAEIMHPTHKVLAVKLFSEPTGVGWSSHLTSHLDRV